MNNYDDIINLKHSISSRRKKMTIKERAGQFAPFSALSGYGEKLKEVSMILDNKRELCEEEKERINSILRNAIKKEIIVYYFVSKNDKNGLYKTYKGIVKNIDLINNNILFYSGFSLKMENILDIEIID